MTYLSEHLSAGFMQPGPEADYFVLFLWREQLQGVDLGYFFFLKEKGIVSVLWKINFVKRGWQAKHDFRCFAMS